MKIHPKENVMQSQSEPYIQKEGGFVATTLFIALLAIMLMLATAGGMAVIHLHNEVKVLERQQIKKFEVLATNSVSTVSSNCLRTNTK